MKYLCKFLRIVWFLYISRSVTCVHEFYLDLYKCRYTTLKHYVISSNNDHVHRVKNTN